MKRMCCVRCVDLCKSAYDELNLLNSLISAIRESCLNLELNAQYYDTSGNSTLKISEERNRYISLSELAIERLKNIEKLNIKLENEVILK